MNVQAAFEIYQKILTWVSVVGFSVLIVPVLARYVLPLICDALAALRRAVGPVGLVVLLLFSCECVIHAQKDYSSEGGVTPRLGLTAEQYGAESPYDDETSTSNLVISAIRVDDGVVSLSISLSAGFPSSQCIDFYANWALTNRTWSYLGAVDICSAFSNVVVSLDWQQIVSNAVETGDFPAQAGCDCGYFMISWHGDFDLDGLLDGVERFVYHTDPRLYDTDGDGLCDGDEILYFGTDPLKSDTDGDGLTDAWELEYYDPLIVDDESADPDEDGLPNSEECAYGTDPFSDDTDWDCLPDAWEIATGLDPLNSGGLNGRNGDPDGDGLSNSAEYEIGTDPFSADTDGDGIVDSIDEAPLSPTDICFGQSDKWVRTYFANPSSIISVGYTNWVNSQIGIGIENGYCLFTAEFPETPAQPVLLRVGPYRVMVDSSGTYPFLLEKGIEYQFGTYPFISTVVYSAIDDLAPSMPFAASPADACAEWTVDGGRKILFSQTDDTLGCFNWLPIIRGTPDVSHVGPASAHMQFSVSVSDSLHADEYEYQWVCENSDIVILRPNARSTEVVFTTMPSWRTAELKVLVQIGTNTLISVLDGFSYGENRTPQATIGLSVPAAVLLNTNEVSNSKLLPVTVSFMSDVPTNGLIRLFVRGGDDKISLWHSRTKASRVNLNALHWNAADFQSETVYVEGMKTSDELGDVEFVAEFEPDVGMCQTNLQAMTVVKVRDVVLPDEPEGGLVVNKGSVVSMKVLCEPEGADSLVLTMWSIRKMLAGMTFSEWSAVGGYLGGAEYQYTATTGGIFQIRATVRAMAGSADKRYYQWQSNEPGHLGKKKVGDLKMFGVCDSLWQLSLRNIARSCIGSMAYGLNVLLPANHGYQAYDPGVYKCNIFVGHMIAEASLNPPFRAFPYSSNAPLAREWYDDTQIGHWLRLPTEAPPQPGYVASQGSHCGVIDFDGMAISAQTDYVTRRSEETCSLGVFRRHTDEE